MLTMVRFLRLAALLATSCAGLELGRRPLLGRLCGAGAAALCVPVAPAYAKASAIVGTWAATQEASARFALPASGDLRFQRDGEVELAAGEGAVVPGGSDFTIEAKGGGRTVTFVLDYAENQLKYVGRVDDAAVGVMRGDILELVKGGEEVRIGSFAARQTASEDVKAVKYYAKPAEGVLKPGLDLGGRPRWQVEKELAARKATDDSDAARANNRALMEKYGCADQASCVEALRADRAFGAVAGDSR